MSCNILPCRSLFAALALAASVGAAGGASPLAAADLDYGAQASPYDDPRYNDIYRHPPPQAPYPPAPVYRDERYAPPPPPVYYPREARVPDCLPHHVINERLQNHGWSDFHNFQVAGNVTHVRARRPSGRLFDLAVDRCSGEILGRQPVEGLRADIPPPPTQYQPGYPGGGYQGDWRYRGY